MPVNQGVRCQLEADVSLAVVCFGDELKTGARSTLEFLDAAVSLGFRSVELCDRSVRDPATVRQALRDRDLVCSGEQLSEAKKAFRVGGEFARLMGGNVAHRYGSARNQHADPAAEQAA